MNKAPIFICGPSRSGTAMLRAALNRNDNVYITSETHYFDDLRTKLAAPEEGALSEADIGRAYEYFGALTHRPYGHGGVAEKGTLDRQALESKAKQLGGTGDDYFQAFCEISGDGKIIWGEKTPRHIFRIDEILSAFPDARVICMARDPRGVTASYRNWKNQGGFDLDADPDHKTNLELEEKRVRASYHPATIALLWKGQMNSALLAQEKWGADKVLFVQYEELVRSPSESFQEICQWLDIPHQAEMEDMPMLNSSFSKFEEGKGASTAPIDRWKKKLPLRDICVVERLCKKQMDKLDYETTQSGGMGFSEFLLWLVWPVSVVRATIANANRSGNLFEYIWQRMKRALA